MNVEYLLDVIILLSAAVIVVPLFQFLRLGAIPGFLVAGILLGPSALGFIDKHDEIAAFAELGVVLLLFVIGVEISPVRLWRIRRLVLGLGTAQVVVTGVLITAVVHALLDIAWELALLIGMGLGLSSTAFVLQLLSERKMLYSEYGRAAVAVLLLQDLAVVPLLAFVGLIAPQQSAVAQDVVVALLQAAAIIGLIVLAGRYVLNPLLKLVARFGSPEIFTASVLLLVLGAAHMLEGIGLSMAMGAFIAGLLIADSPFRHQIVAEIQPFRGLLLGLFFMSMGMALNLDVFLEQPWLFATLVPLLMAGKAAILWVLAQLFGLRPRVATSVALVLGESGEFALVLFAVAFGKGLLSDALFQQLLVVVLLSMLLTPALEAGAYAIHRLARRRSPAAGGLEEVGADGQGAQPVVLAGFGRMGHRVGHILELMEMPYVAIDQDPAVVERERASGRAVYFGDARRPEVLRAAGAAAAPFVIVAIDDPDATAHVVATLHSAFPQTPVFARARDLASCRELRALGAQFTVSETLEASAELARAALLHAGTDEEAVTTVLEQFRDDYYGRLRD